MSPLTKFSPAQPVHLARACSSVATDPNRPITEQITYPPSDLGLPAHRPSYKSSPPCLPLTSLPAATLERGERKPGRRRRPAARWCSGSPTGSGTATPPSPTRPASSRPLVRLGVSRGRSPGVAVPAGCGDRIFAALRCCCLILGIIFLGS